MSETNEVVSNDGKTKKPAPRRRQTHNAVERRRKDKINGWISKIAELLPCKEIHKKSKISTLEQTVDYIKLLVTEREKLLSDKCSEVQAEEVKQLKKKVTYITEQNTVYEKLLLEAKVNINSLSEKVLKYSDKFEKKNGTFVLKNSSPQDSSQSDKAIQVNITDTDKTCQASPPSNNNQDISNVCKKTKISKSKNSSKSSLKPKTSNSIASCPVVLPNVPVLPAGNQISISTSSSTLLVNHNGLKENQLVHDIVFPNIASGDNVKNATIHTGGVTTALSQFPVMSTTQGSSVVSVCNKNMSTIIIPTGGSILQHYPPPEKSSNTISIICPSTLPILWPQLINVASVTRNVGLPSLICPTPIDNPCLQTDKTSINNTVLTINSNTVVPISSNISANASIVLPTQPTLIGNPCANSNLFPLPQTDPIIVPLQQAVTLSPTSEASDKSVQSPNLSSNQNSQIKNKIVIPANNVVTNDNEAKHTNSSILTLLSAMAPLTVPKNSSPVETGSNETIQTQNPEAIQSTSINSTTIKSVQSLLILSTKKMISHYLNQSQNMQASLSMYLGEKTSAKCPISLQSNSDKNDQSSDKLCLQIDAPEVSEYLSNNKDSNTNIPKQNVPITASSSVSNNSFDSTSLSKFSLTALIRNSVSSQNDCNTPKQLEQNKSFNSHNSIQSKSNVPATWPSNITHQKQPAVVKSSSLTHFGSSLPDTESGSVNHNSNIVKDLELEHNITPSLNTISPQASKCNQLSGPTQNDNSSIPYTSSNSESLINHSVILNSSSHNSNENNSVPRINFNNRNSQNQINDEKTNSVPLATSMCRTHSEDVDSVNIQVPNNVFSENMSFVVNDCAINQNTMPSVFSINQVVSLNSTAFVNSSLPENTFNTSISPHSATVSNPLLSSVTSMSSTSTYSKLPNFSTVNKENSLLLASSAIPVSNECPEKPNIPSENATIRSIGNDALKTQDLMTPNKSSSLNNRGDRTKPVSNCKKRKTSPKLSRMSGNSICNDNNISQIGSTFDADKVQVSEKSGSLAKSDECARQESNTYFGHCDILARATESIFGSDVLDKSYTTKTGLVYYSPEVTAVNPTVAINSKVNDILQCSTNMEDVTSDTSKVHKDVVESSNIHHSSSLMNINNETGAQAVCEMNDKQSKQAKARKCKMSLDDEPPLKKSKEVPSNSEKSSGVHTFTDCHQLLDSPLKTASSETAVTDITHSVIDSIGNFGNQIQIPENNCKTPTTVDTIFSLNPILGDILKDVTHGIGLESRNSFLTYNENQSIFNTDKNYHSVNFSSSPSEEYINLPRMNFSSSSENPHSVQATNVSFAHTASLCATLSDSSKTTDTVSLSEPQLKVDSKKKNSSCSSDQNHNLSVLTLSKSSECNLKLNHSDSLYNVTSKATSASSRIFDRPNIHNVNINATAASNPSVSLAESQFTLRGNGYASVSSVANFYPTITNTSSVQNFASSSSSMLHHSNFNCINSSSLVNPPFQKQITNACHSNSFNSQSTVETLNHSLSSLLKENGNTNILENRTGSNCQTSQSAPTSSSNISQSKYSALSLISDQPSFSESVSSSANHSDYIQSSVVGTSVSSSQFTSTSTTCPRNQRASLSYSAESLLQTSCISSDKNKNKNPVTNRYAQRITEKKTNVTNMHNISDTPIFLPASSCDITLQNAPLVPLPPVTSFHNFSSSYNPCETVSTSIFNGMSRTHDVPLTLSNDNFLNMNLTVENQMLSNRNETQSSIPKHHSNISLPFESHTSLYNNCNFLPHVKPTLDNSRISESGPCFQPTSFSNNYTQASQKTNCCNFSHRSIPANSEITSDLNLPVGPPVPPFHPDKNNFQTHRPPVQPPFSQSNANFVGNIFYSTTNTREVNDMTSKPSNTRPSQEIFVPDSRQSVHDHIIFPNRKAVVSNRSKSKKSNKNINVNDSNINLISNMATFGSVPDTGCSKSNISCVPNGYFKNNSRPPLPSNQLQCSQQKMSENSTTSVIPSNPPFNPVLHQQGDNFLNLNFQHPNFPMSQLPRPPTQPLSCSCLTTPIISHTYSPTTHPVPNFNLSNILPDMGCSNNQVSISPVKFPSINHGVQSSGSPSQTNSAITNTAHIISHQSCAPTLYPSHAPMVRSSLNPILGHNPQSFGENQVSLVGTGAAPGVPQNTSFSATQNPPFRNVIHSLPFVRSDR